MCSRLLEGMSRNRTCIAVEVLVEFGIDSTGKTYPVFDVIPRSLFEPTHRREIVSGAVF